MTDHLASWQTLDPFLKPIKGLLMDDSITDIFVNPDTIFCTKHNRTVECPEIEFPQKRIHISLQNIARMSQHNFDEKSPTLHLTLPDGSRLAAVGPPICPDGYAMAIRKFPSTPYSLQDLIRTDTLPADIGQLLQSYVQMHANILIIGATGAGKTTLLNALASEAQTHERFVVIQDVAEVKIAARNKLYLLSSRGNEVRPEVTIRDLLADTLRLKPDRILIGELRKGEAYDFLQAINTGHSGCLTTIHANSCSAALTRLSDLVLQADVGLPHAAIRRSIASALNILIFISQEDGIRAVREVMRLDAYDEQTDSFSMSPLYTCAGYSPITSFGMAIGADNVDRKQGAVCQ